MRTVFEKVKEFVRSLDIILLLICLACSGISLICLWSFYITGQQSLKKVFIQAVAIGLGVIAALIISVIDYEFMAKLWKLHAPLTILLVVLTFFIGVAPNPDAPTDRAWLDLGITTFQPSELLKLSFILTFSLHLSKVGDQINHLRPFLLLCLHGAAPVMLIVAQSDYGTALVLVVIFAAMMFAAGLSLRWIAVGIAAAVAAAPFIWLFLLPPFLKERFFVAWHPENYLSGTGKGWQQYRGKLALGSGQLIGRGLGSDNLYNKVPEAHNDFIFSYIGQTMGFVGCIITLLLITLMCVKILLIAKMSKDKLGSYICIGVFAMLIFQTVVNIGMVLCVIPVVGITLPFFSAGGTSVAVSYMAIGLVLSVYRKNKKDLMFD